MLFMLLLVLAEDAQVVQVDYDEEVQVGAEDVVHEGLKRGRGIGEAEA